MADSQYESRQVSVSLYEEDVALIEQVSRVNNLRNFSAALRLIINDYRTTHPEPRRVSSTHSK
jgi:hypothetical protein